MQCLPGIFCSCEASVGHRRWRRHRRLHRRAMSWRRPVRRSKSSNRARPARARRAHRPASSRPISKATARRCCACSAAAASISTTTSSIAPPRRQRPRHRLSAERHVRARVLRRRRRSPDRAGARRSSATASRRIGCRRRSSTSTNRWPRSSARGALFIPTHGFVGVTVADARPRPRPRNDSAPTFSTDTGADSDLRDAERPRRRADRRSRCGTPIASSSPPAAGRR